MANLIQAILELKDNFTPKMEGVRGSLANAVLQGNLMSSALSTAFNVATSAVGAFTSALGDAIDTQQTVIMTAGSMATIMGTDFQEGSEFVNDMTGRLAILAGSLPGTTADFTSFARGIVDDLAIINKEMNGGALDLTSFNEQIDTVTSKFQLLANQPGLSKAQSMGAFQSILGGRSLDQLEKLEFFRANPSFINALKQVEEGLGRSFEEMTKPERLEGLIQALNTSITDETLAELTKSLGSQIEGLKTKLFDPNVGTFGLMNDVFEDLEGEQTVIEALTRSATVLFGSDNSLFATLGDLFETLGLSTDPMLVLYNFIEDVNEQILGVTVVVRRINSFLANSNDIEALPNFVQDNFGELVRKYADGFIDNIDEWIPQAFQVIYQGLVFAFDTLDVINNNIDWAGLIGSIANGVGDAILFAFQPENLASTAKVIAVIGLAALAPVAAASVIAMFNPLFAAVALGGIGLVNAYRENWDSVVLGAQYTVEQIADAIINKASEIHGWITGKMESIKLGIVSFFDQFGEVWGNLAETVMNALGRVTQIASIPTSMAASPLSVVSTAANVGSNIAERVFGGSRSDGNIPNYDGGFLNNLVSSVQREARAMPSGSRVVIANSSEAILNRAQQAALGRSQPNFIPGNLTIQNLNLPFSPGVDPEQLANQVMSRISDKFNEWRSSQLSSVVS